MARSGRNRGQTSPLRPQWANRARVSREGGEDGCEGDRAAGRGAGRGDAAPQVARHPCGGHPAASFLGGVPISVLMEFVCAAAGRVFPEDLAFLPPARRTVGEEREEQSRARSPAGWRADAGRTGGVSALRPARRRVPAGRVGVPQRQSGARGGVRGPSSRRERRGRAGLGPWRWGADAPRVSAAGPLCPGPVQPLAWPTPAPRAGGLGRRRTAVCPGASPVPGSLPSAGVGEVEQSPRPHRPPQRPGCHPSSCGPESQCPFPARPLGPGPAGSGRLPTPLRPPPPPRLFRFGRPRFLRSDPLTLMSRCILLRALRW